MILAVGLLYRDTNDMFNRILNFALILILLIRSDVTMARGNPDYGTPDYTFFAVETPISDVVAERQGFSRLDNRGRVLWIDDFRGGLSRWWVSSDAGGTNPILTYESGRVLGYYGSVKIDPLVNGGTSEVGNNLLLPVSKRLGIETGIYLLTNFGRVEIDLGHNYLAGTSKSMSLQITYSNGHVDIVTPSGTQTIATVASIGELVNRWVAIKIVGDYSTNHYYKLMLGNVEYDLSSYLLNNSVDGMSGATNIEIISAGVSAVYKEEFYLGYVIISGDEP